jgi:hypothetical protein
MINNDNYDEDRRAGKLYTTSELYEIAFEKEIKLIRAETQPQNASPGKATHSKFLLKHETTNSPILNNEPIDKNIIKLVEYLAVNQILTFASCEGSRKEGLNNLAYIGFINYSHLTRALELLRNLAEEKQKDVLSWRIAGYYSVPDGRESAELFINGHGWLIEVSRPPLTTADPEGRCERRATIRFPKSDLLELNSILP